MPNRRFRSRRGSSGRQRTTWNNFGLTFALGQAGVTGFFDLTPRPLNNDDEPHGTAVIKRLLLTVNAIQAQDVQDVTQNFAIGFYVANGDAVDNNQVTSPLLNTQRDWHYWTARATFREVNGGIQNLMWDADIRSSRRLRGDQRYIIVVQPDTANTSNLEVVTGIRALWAISN